MPLNDRESLLTRELPDGRVLDLVPLVGGRVRLTLSASFDDDGYLEGW